jgi:thiamine biosynthesis lipoprotein
VADPAHPGAALTQWPLSDAAIATSANTVSVVRFGGNVRGHVMNPATGYPADALLQATVVARTATAADARSKALFVSGREPPGILRSYRVERPRTA